LARGPEGIIIGRVRELTNAGGRRGGYGNRTNVGTRKTSDDLIVVYPDQDIDRRSYGIRTAIFVKKRVTTVIDKQKTLVVTQKSAVVSVF
jgi:hypothetical protein